MPPNVEFVEDREVAAKKLQKIKTGLSYLNGKYLPATAYAVLLDIAIRDLTPGKNSLFYFPIPWEKDTGFPSHPSLVADARHYCQTNNSDESTNLIVNSFAGWQMFWKKKVFCCCGKGRVGRLERFVPIEIVIHHPIHIDRESNCLTVKQLVGIKSADRDHIEKHYNLRRESRVDKNISIVRTDSVKIALPGFELIENDEECSDQFDADIFKSEFGILCKTALRGLA